MVPHEPQRDGSPVYPSIRIGALRRLAAKRDLSETPIRMSPAKYHDASDDILPTCTARACWSPGPVFSCVTRHAGNVLGARVKI